MDIKKLKALGEFRWLLEKQGRMKADAVFFGGREAILNLDDQAARQLEHVAMLPGIVGPACAMPDAHFGYGFPIGGVGAFDPKHGVVSAGGVGFDISCGVRTLSTGLKKEEVQGSAEKLAEKLFKKIPAGTGVGGDLQLSESDTQDMLANGASWAVGLGLGQPDDLGRIEENGRMPGADPTRVSAKAQMRIRDQIGTLGSGNHYLEVQYVDRILNNKKAQSFGIAQGDVLVSIHCGSRGLGHQIGKDYLPRMISEAKEHGIKLPSKEIACAPINSELGRDYLGAMAAGINCALANRQVLAHLTREIISDLYPDADIRTFYDVSHNTCKKEIFVLKGKKRELYVHRKGATRALGPRHPLLPPEFRGSGQPVIIGGSMGTSSFILAGRTEAEELSFSSACHGAGRLLSRSQAKKKFRGKDLVEHLRHQGIILKCSHLKGVAEEAPGAYKDVQIVVEATSGAGLTDTVAELKPIICIKG